MKLLKTYTKEFGNFLILWFGQSISSLGSAMTGFAITIWAYEKTGSVLVLSVSGMLIMIPKVMIGVLVGPVVDHANKKVVMVLADIGAGFCTLTLLLLLHFETLEIWHIYGLNICSSMLSSFQAPASNAAISTVIPKKYYMKANGLQSFSSGIVQILAPVFAVLLLGIAGLTGVIIMDFITMAFACLTLVFLVKIPIMNKNKENKSKFNTRSYFDELLQGFKIIKTSKLLRKLMVFMVFINFAAGIAYYSLLSPMILAKTSNNPAALALVNGAIGLGSIIGALLLLIIPAMKRKAKSIFFCAALSFLFGDILLAVSDTVVGWIIAGFLSCVFLPLLNANETYFWRTIIPIELQGRAFSLKYSLQLGIIPVGIFVGGVLADHILEPFMIAPPKFFENILGSGSGTGMALMFLISGTLGVIISLMGFFSRSVQKAEFELDI